MQIKQLSNKKIQFCKAGKIVFSCLPSQNYRVRNAKEIQLISTGQPAYSIFADEITEVSILGGVLTAVTFDNSQQLAEYLDTNFFFEELDDTNIFSEFGATGEYNQAHSATKPTISTSTALVNGTQYAIPIYLSGSYAEFALIQIATLVGNFNFAIYDCAVGVGVACAPNNKVYQSPEFTTVAARTTLSVALSPAVTLKEGWYFFSYWSNVALTFSGMLVGNTFLGYSLTATPAMSTITRLVKTGTYAATMPDTFPAGYSSDLANPSNPILFFKKQL